MYPAALALCGAVSPTSALMVECCLPPTPVSTLRSDQVRGRRNLPAGNGAAIFAGNHPSGLVDPMVLMAAMPELAMSVIKLPQAQPPSRPPSPSPARARPCHAARPGPPDRWPSPPPSKSLTRHATLDSDRSSVAKHSLFSTPVVSFFLKAMRAVPVAKAYDAGLAPDKQPSLAERRAMNAEMFATVEARLKADVSIVIFPGDRFVRVCLRAPSSAFPLSLKRYGGGSGGGGGVGGCAHDPPPPELRAARCELQANPPRFTRVPPAQRGRAIRPTRSRSSKAGRREWR